MTEVVKNKVNSGKMERYKTKNGGGCLKYFFILFGFMIAGAVIAWLIFGDKKPIEVEMDSGVKAKFNATLKDSEITREKDGKKLWDFKVEEAVSDKTIGKTSLKGITGRVYRDDGTYFDIKADNGEMKIGGDEFSLQDNVCVTHSDCNAKILANKIVWNQKTEVIIAKGNVEMWKDNWYAISDQAETTGAFKRLRLKGNAKVIKKN